MPIEFVAGSVVGLFIGSLCAGLVAALISALFLQLAAQWGDGLDIPYGSAYLTMLFVHILSGVVLGGASVALVLSQLPPNATPETMKTFQPDQGTMLSFQLASIPIGFVMQAFVVSGRHGLAFSRGLKITFIMYLLGLVLAVVLVAAVVGVILLAQHQPR